MGQLCEMSSFFKSDPREKIVPNSVHGQDQDLTESIEKKLQQATKLHEDGTTLQSNTEFTAAISPLEEPPSIQ